MKLSRKNNYGVFAVLLFLFLPGCAMPAPGHYEPPQTTITQLQGACFSRKAGFLDQVTCMQWALSSDSANPYAQEYLANAQALAAKVKAKTLSEEDARLQLVQRLSELREKESREIAQREALSLEREKLTYQILQQNKPPLLELRPIQPVSRSPITTNCRTYGGQVNCTTY